MPISWPTTLFYLVVLWHASSTSADCECGYRVPYSGPSSKSPLLFTEAVQINLRELNDLSESQDLKINYVELDYVPDSDRYGRRVEDKNIVLNPLADISAGWNSPSIQGPDVDAGLQLFVRSDLINETLVSTGQVQSTREDIQFGSFRAYIKSTDVSGTCAATFWYHNDSQEIDIELLTRQRECGNSPINLSVHSNASVANDYDGRNTTGYLEAMAGFDPAADFHEYRYDWSPDLVSYYSDGYWMGDLNTSIPAVPGIFQLSHWSNGYAEWSGGPPLQDAVITVAYFMAYFNSTDQTRVQQFETACGGDLAIGRICEVPDFDECNTDAGPIFV